jgi:hypothetical protein
VATGPAGTTVRISTALGTKAGRLAEADAAGAGERVE